MQLSFLNETEHRKENIIIPQIHQLKRQYLLTTLKLTKYYRNHRFYLPDSHILKRLLKELDVSGSRDLTSYIDHARDKISGLSFQFGLSSVTNFGRVQDPALFLNSNVSEIVILHGEQFDVDKAIKYWRELEPVKFMDHPHTDLNYGLPDGNYNSTERGVAVISINLPMLALQYRLWSLDELTKDDPYRISTFIAGYVLNNAMRSHYDIAVFNRLVNIMSNNDSANKPYKRVQSLGMIDLTSDVDLVLAAYVKAIRNKRMAFVELLHTIPAVTCSNFIYRCKLLDVPNTSQVAWASYASIIKKLVWLCRVSDELNIQLNQGNIADVRWLTRQLNNNAIFQRGYPAELIDYLSELSGFLDLRL